MKRETIEHRIYPAIFHKDEQGYWVEFPDLPGCNTQGETLEEAFKMAKEALALYLDGEQDVKPSLVENIRVEGNDRVMLVEAADGDDIEHFKKSEIPEAFENGLKNKGFTQYQVSQILDIDKAYVSRIAKGERIPSPDMAKRIGVLLGFDWRIFYSDNNRI